MGAVGIFINDVIAFGFDQIADDIGGGDDSLVHCISLPDSQCLRVLQEHIGSGQIKEIDPGNEDNVLPCVHYFQSLDQLDGKIGSGLGGQPSKFVGLRISAHLALSENIRQLCSAFDSDPGRIGHCRAFPFMVHHCQLIPVS